MNDLQIALIAAGAAAVAGVWGYNKWQERQHRQLAEKIFKGGQPDVLLGGESASTEPSLGDAPLRTQEAEDPVIGDFAAAATVTPAPEDVQETAAAAPDAPTVLDAPDVGLPPPPAEYADDIADCVVHLEFTEAVPAPALWAMQARWAGGSLIRRALIRVDDAEQAGRRAGPAARAVARMPELLGLRLPR